MLEVKTARPHPLLTRYVRAYVQRDFRLHGAEVIEPVVARLGMMLEFQFREPYRIPSFADNAENPCSPITIIGPISRRRVRLIVRGNVSALAVIFEPAGFHRMFRVPAWPMAERGTEGHAVLGIGVSQLYEQLGNIDSFRQRVNLLNNFLLLRLERSGTEPHSLRGLRTLLEGGDHKTVAHVSKQIGMSPRHLERMSLEYFGVPPKMLARISRFQRALSLAAKGSGSWLQVAHASSYYDQMHMIRDFRTFAGGPPRKSFTSIAPHHLVNFQQ